MLTITIPGAEYFDEELEEFITYDGTVLQLEHSLVALSKWESITEKAFLGNQELTPEEVLLYFQCMSIDEKTPPEIFQHLTEENIQAINKYIEAKMSATWFNDRPGRPTPRMTITAELIYHWMFSAEIPIECETWHLNRLFTLIKIYGVKNAPAKKIDKHEAARQQRELNAQRRAQHGSSG